MDSRSQGAALLALLLLQGACPLSTGSRLWTFTSSNSNSSGNGKGKAPPPLLAHCPSSPTSNCSFYFNNSRSTIPTFNLTAKQGSEQMLGGAVVFNSSSISLTAISNTGLGLPSFFMQWNSTNSNGTTGNQFYGTKTAIYARTFNKPAISAFFSSDSNVTCVLLPITNAQLKNGSKVVNLNPGQTPEIPESARCIVFNITK